MVLPETAWSQDMLLSCLAEVASNPHPAADAPPPLGADTALLTEMAAPMAPRPPPSPGPQTLEGVTGPAAGLSPRRRSARPRTHVAHKLAMATRASLSRRMLAAVLIAAFSSSFASVFFERILKEAAPRRAPRPEGGDGLIADKPRRASLWERNVQLATWSLFIYVPMAYYAHPHDLLDGWSSLTFLVACLGALGGILIGLVLKYCDAIVKNLALSTAIITTAVLDWAYFAGPMTTPIVAAAGIIIVSIVTYQSAPG